MFCCTLLYVHSSFAIILIGKRKLVTLLDLSSWCLMVVVKLLNCEITPKDALMKICFYMYSLRKLWINQERTMISYAVFIYSGMFHKFLNVSTYF